MSNNHVVGLLGLVIKKYRNTRGDGCKYKAIHNNQNACKYAQLFGWS